MKISRNELKNRYGIDLPVGKYRIKVDGGSYTINTVKDDTEGCILVGLNKVVGKVIDSQKTFTKLMKDYLLPAKRKGEKVYITIA